MGAGLWVGLYMDDSRHVDYQALPRDSSRVRPQD